MRQVTWPLSGHRHGGAGGLQLSTQCWVSSPLHPFLAGLPVNRAAGWLPLGEGSSVLGEPDTCTSCFSISLPLSFPPLPQSLFPVTTWSALGFRVNTLCISPDARAHKASSPHEFLHTPPRLAGDSAHPPDLLREQLERELPQRSHNSFQENVGSLSLLCRLESNNR